MSNGVVFRSAIWGALVFAPFAILAQMPPAQSFSASTTPSGMQGPAAASSAPDSGLYEDGMRAITDGRWLNAEAIFTKVATQHGQHFDGITESVQLLESRRDDERVAQAFSANRRVV